MLILSTSVSERKGLGPTLTVTLARNWSSREKASTREGFLHEEGALRAQAWGR